MPFFFTLNYQILGLLLIIGLLLPSLLQMSMRVVKKIESWFKDLKNPPLEHYFQTLLDLQNHHQEISITFLFCIIINNVMLQTFGTILGNLPLSFMIIASIRINHEKSKLGKIGNWTNDSFKLGSRQH